VLAAPANFADVSAAVAAPRPLSVVVPCCNEAESLPKLAEALEALQAALADRYSVDFVLVDDGSRDETWRLLEARYANRDDVRLVRHETNRGVAAAIASGLAHAPAEIAASIDADCTYDPRQLEAMLPLLGPSVDLVVASPYHPLGCVAGVPRWRLAISRVASRLYRLLLRNKLHTYTSCFRVYRRAALAGLPATSPGFVGIVELLWLLDCRGSRIVECPAVLTVRTTGHSKLRVLRTALAHGRLLLRAALHRLLGAPTCSPAASGPLLADSSATPPSFTT
jgi:dolichol-phosphate mannosyltransferase